MECTYRIKANEVVPYTGTAGNSAAIPLGIKAVRIVVTTAAHVAIGKTVTATTGDMLVFPNLKGEIFACHEGDRVSAVQSAAGGNLHVTLLTR